MIFYFVATRPYLEKAYDSRIFYVIEDAEKVSLKAQELANMPGIWRVYQAEAINITEVVK